MHGLEKRIVYILRSDADPSRHYVGITDSIDARLEWHNRGPSGYTVNYRPWSLVVAIGVPHGESSTPFRAPTAQGA